MNDEVSESEVPQSVVARSIGVGVCAECAAGGAVKVAAMLVGGTSLCLEHGVTAVKTIKSGGR